MARDFGTLWPIEPHTEAKHEILRRYLGAWFGILGSKHRRVVFVDGFCGPGRYLGGEDGSPLIALGAAAGHVEPLELRPEFLFIDERADRIKHLHKEVDKLGWREQIQGIDIRCAAFASEFEAFLDGLPGGSKSSPPIFAFVDPFGFTGIPFSLIARFLRQKRAELFINLNTDDLNRFLEHPDSAVREGIEETFGTLKVIEVLERPGSTVRNLRDLYQEQLQNVASVRFVRHFEMRDRQNQVTYHLVFATNDRTGHVKMKESMWRADSTGSFSFSDADDPRQGRLLGGPDYDLLADIISVQFAGRTVTSAGVQVWVEDHTIYCRSHMLEALKTMEEGGRVVVDKLKTDGTRRIAGTYPPAARLTFPESPEG